MPGPRLDPTRLRGEGANILTYSAEITARLNPYDWDRSTPAAD